MRKRVFRSFIPACLLLLSGCANISTPSGGKRDTVPPKLLRVEPADSILNTRVSRLYLQFDEYVNTADVSKEVEVSPVLPVPPVVTAINKHVTVKIPDSLLDPNTTYRISLGKAIRDVHEGNAFTGYTYTFSTGSYFDSLELSGSILEAVTGLPDTAGITVVLHEVGTGDSAVVKEKPRYKTRPDNKGNFTFRGLPARPFRIYAIGDENGNMIYDGGTETIGFCDSVLHPADSFEHPVIIRVFAEKQDSSVSADTAAKKKGLTDRGKMRGNKPAMVDTNFTCNTNIDTSAIARRTFDVTDSIKLVYNHLPVIDADSISLTRDSAGVALSIPIRLTRDVKDSATVYIHAPFEENTVYALTLRQGFAHDTSGRELPTIVYRFRTFSAEDYGTIMLNVPVRYTPAGSDTSHLITMLADDKIIGTVPVTDSVITLKRLRPASYSFRIIVDANGNGVWDPGDLFSKIQPELVIPGGTPSPLKAGWNNTIDLDTKPAVKNIKRTK